MPMERRSMSDRKPMLLVLAGPNGSGKSTITQYFEKVGTYTNADDVVATTGMSNEKAAKFVDDIRYRSIETKEDLTFETVLSSKYKLEILEKAKFEGYFTKCIFYMYTTIRRNQFGLFESTRMIYQFIRMCCGLRSGF